MKVSSFLSSYKDRAHSCCARARVLGDSFFSEIVRIFQSLLAVLFCGIVLSGALSHAQEAPNSVNSPNSAVKNNSTQNKNVNPANSAVDAQAVRAEAAGLEKYLINLNRSASLSLALPPGAAGRDSAALPIKRVAKINLRDAIEISKEYSNTLASSNSRFLQSEYQSSAARGALLPRIDLRASGGTETSSPASIVDAKGKPVATDTHSRSDTSVTVSQSLFDWSAINEWRKQNKLTQAARTNFDSEFDTHILSVTDAYLGLIQARLILSLNNEYETQVNGLLRYIQTRSNLGANSRADEERVRGQVLNIRAASIEIAGQFEAGVIIFKRLTGIEPASIDIPQPLEPAVPRTSSEAMNLALANNPDILSARLLLESSERAKSVSFGKMLPKLDLQYSNTSSANAGGVDYTQRSNSLMLVGTWNALNGGTDYYQNRLNAEKYSEQVFALKEAERKLQEGLDLSVNAYQSTRGRIEAASREQAANLAVVRAYVRQMEGGARSIPDMLDAYQRLYQSRTDLVRLTIARTTLAYQILRLTGGLRASLVS